MSAIKYFIHLIWNAKTITHTPAPFISEPLSIPCTDAIMPAELSNDGVYRATSVMVMCSHCMSLFSVGPLLFWFNMCSVWGGNTAGAPSLLCPWPVRLDLWESLTTKSLEEMSIYTLTHRSEIWGMTCSSLCPSIYFTGLFALSLSLSHPPLPTSPIHLPTL